MYCRNCGSPILLNAPDVCANCGANKGDGSKFCPNCGTPLLAEEVTPPKSKLVAGLLALFLGTFGIHNFYLGYTTKAIIQLSVSVVFLVLGCCTVGISCIVTAGIGIWAFVEGILILTGKIDKDGQGRPLGD